MSLKNVARKVILAGKYYNPDKPKSQHCNTSEYITLRCADFDSKCIKKLPGPIEDGLLAPLSFWEKGGKRRKYRGQGAGTSRGVRCMTHSNNFTTQSPDYRATAHQWHSTIK